MRAIEAARARRQCARAQALVQALRERAGRATPAPEVAQPRCRPE